MERPSQWREIIIVAAILGSSFAFSGIVAWQLLQRPNAFLGMMLKPPFWQGGLEALVVVVAFGLLQLLQSRWLRVALCVLLAELFLRRHTVDVATFVDLVYFELVIAIGALIARLCGCRRTDSIADYLRCFVLGFCAWGVCAWGLSALGWGGVHALRWLTALLLIPALLARSRPWVVFVEQRVRAMPVGARICAGMIVGWFLVLFAHTGTAIGFDSLWYGLRGDRVLVGEGSAFVSQGLATGVYYFPKVYELFLVPLSGLGSNSVVSGITVLILGLIAAAVYDILRLLRVRDALPRLACVGLIVTLPAIANYALEAKPDLLAAFLLLLAWINAAAFVTKRNRANLLWLIALLIFSTQAKLTSIPFAAGLFLATCIALLRHRSCAETPEVKEMRIAVTAFVLMLAVTAFATARTLLLTGMPTIGPEPLFKLWTALSFSLTYPVGSMHWSYPKDWSDIPALIVDLLFRPQKLQMVQITWTGNVWIWLAAIALCVRILIGNRQTLHIQASASPNETSAAYCTGTGLLLMALVLMLCWGYGYRGGDGNYFIAGIVPAILFGIAMVWLRLPDTSRIQGSFFLAVSVFCLFQASYSFVSVDWSGGTRAFDLSFGRSSRQFAHDTRRMFRENGITRIAEHLRKAGRNPRVVGCTALSNMLGMRLPGRYEDSAQISWAHAEYIDTPEHFVDFIKADRIDYLLVPAAGNTQADCQTGHTLLDVAASLQGNPDVPALVDDDYVLYDVRAWRH